MQKKSALYRMIVTALLLALGLVLPFLTGQLPAIGSMLSPLHIPALICGLTCGWGWGAALGLVLPVLRMVIFGMPPAPAAYPMAFELCAYGLVAGLVYPWLRRALNSKPLVAILLSLAIAMVAGRLVGGAAKALMLAGGVIPGAPLTFGAFIASYFTGTAVGAAIHLVVIPPIVLALEKAHLSPNA